MAKRWWALFGLGIVLLAVLVGAVWYRWSLQPANPGDNKSQSYQLQTGTSAPDVADELQSAGLLKSSSAFVIYLTLHNLRGHLQAGTYEISPSDSATEIADKISHGRIAVNRLVVPDGATELQIIKLATDQGIPEADFVAALKATYTSPILGSRPAGDTSLEGYLYPDTYNLIKPVRSQALVQQMIDNLQEKVAATDVVQSFANLGMTFHQGLTLASIVEKEVSNPEDRAMVAQVFINRLKAGQPLQSDVTVIYAANILNKPFDVNLDSQFNTYKYKGLPPGPINNPSIDAIKAVAHPKANDYIYFLADKQGVTHYAKTFEEHKANVKQYLGE